MGNVPVRLGDIIQHQVPDLPLYIARLVSHRHLLSSALDTIQLRRSNTRTFVNPGKSTNVKSSTFGL